jgi:hypothetical protein
VGEDTSLAIGVLQFTWSSFQRLDTWCQPPNKQLQRTVTRRRGRGACASLHYAHAPRWTRGHAAAELRRYAPRIPHCTVRGL